MTKEAFDEIYKKYFPIVVSYLTWLTKNEEDARDWSQDIFMSLYSRQTELTGNIPIKSYLFGAAHNQYAYRMRGLVTKLKYHQHLKRVSVHSTLNSLENKDIRNFLLMALEKVTSPSRREIIRMRFFEGMDYQEITQKRNITPQTAINEIFRGRKIMQNALKQLGPNAEL